MNEKKELHKTGKFLAGIAVLFILFNFLLSIIPLEWFEFFYAFFTLEFLKLFGFNGTIEFQEPVLVYLETFSIPLGFSYLCTGLLELALIWSATLASFGIELKKRIIGSIIGTIILVGFNFFRIISSVLVIAWFGLNAGNFSHDLLFRVFLFVTIAGFYFLWFRWSTKTK
ncbi:MAG: exosortase/archaeosortase family protein [archaeon]|nr:exosortase/archaeosortase family protein [archaeon]